MFALWVWELPSEFALSRVESRVASLLRLQLQISHAVSYFYEKLANHPCKEDFVCPLGVGGTN